MEIKYMDVKEFRESGFLMEANRLFFHPHGLALEVTVEEDGTERLGGVWDCRDDPEGILYGDWPEDADAKGQRVLAERVKHLRARRTLFNAPSGIPFPDVEPVGWTPEATAEEAA